MDVDSDKFNREKMKNRGKMKFCMSEYSKEQF